MTTHHIRSLKKWLQKQEISTLKKPTEEVMKLYYDQMTSKPDYPTTAQAVHSVNYVSGSIDYSIKKELTPMCDKTQTERSALLSALQDARWKKDLALQTKFGIREQDAPKTFTEFKERLDAGQYVIAEDQKDEPCYLAVSLIQWKDPKVKKDRKSYEEAYKVVQTEFDKAQIEIQVLPPEKGLDSLRRFQDFTS